MKIVIQKSLTSVFAILSGIELLGQDQNDEYF